MAWQPQLVRRVDAAGNPTASLGHALVDDYLEFVAARCRPNTLLATAYDLKVFFSVVPKEPTDVVTADIFAFITAQKKPRRGPKVVRLEDGEAGLSARTIKRRLASISGLFGYLMTRDDLAIDRNPVPTGLANRRRSGNRGAPLLRTPRTLPRVLGPNEVELVLGALNTARDRAMVLAMLLGGLRRCEVLGLRLGDLSPGERRVFISEGKGGHQRLIPISAQFFSAVGDYLDRERPPVGHDRLFVVLRGPTRGRRLSADGLDEILDGVRKRTGLPKLTCHQLRHTCLTRLREAGMALEAVQAQAGHRSIESTRVYIHLANSWLVEQYLEASAAIDADRAES
ncbi:tyrosine-type recombinase/integrase [Streptomyces sp. NBC_00873]|uniref:tyrosine-type recombinase/integrase n=1 Tax=unclassified Streptomyces TaxID=2593676 RepID=UPI00386CD4E8|nr:tyrosine-type recombinase/integrase [Streptomyces sp. NBC_00873]WSY96839.1 tyrosine-type recombinase/integrase [Streptomyces sp. NBC_00873]WTA41388.1 tyrosine-type recombinase/integrase [Streptomyces sp. NBC_00842]WTA48509.1 tyrosine-type recombinase/integrase [Streptomyces sp. NBC_00842]